MTEKANMAKKLIITSTEIYENVDGVAQPTRAEISNVTNAVLDGVEYIMLQFDSVQYHNVV